MYWYLMLFLLKKWFDDVFIYNFVYGFRGDRFKGKDLQLIVFVGGQLKYYFGFDIFVMVLEFLWLFQFMVNLVKMNYLLFEWMYWVDVVSEDIISVVGECWVQLIDDFECFDFYNYMNVGMDVDVDSFYVVLIQGDVWFVRVV